MSVEDTAAKTGLLKERNALRAKPRGAMRWKYWSLAGVLMIVAFSYLFPRTEPVNYIYMGLFCAIALAAALHHCGEMWTLKANRSPRWLGYAAGFGSAAIVGTLFVLHELKLFRWSLYYFELPFGLFCAVAAAGAWVTEWRKRVRVYAEVEGLAFVPIDESSNPLMQPTGQERPAAD